MKQRIIILAAIVFACLGGASGAEFSPTQRPTLGAALEEFTSDANHEGEDGGDQVAPLRSDESDDPLNSTFRQDCNVLGEDLVIALLGKKDDTVVFEPFSVLVNMRKFPEIEPNNPFESKFELTHWHKPQQVFVPKLFGALNVQKYAQRELLKTFRMTSRGGKTGVLISVDKVLRQYLNGYFGSIFFMRSFRLDEKNHSLLQAYKSLMDIVSPDGDVYSIAVFPHEKKEPILSYLPGHVNAMYLSRADFDWFLNEFIPNAWAEEEKGDGTEMLVCPEGKIERLKGSIYSRFAPFGPIADQILAQQSEGSPTTKRT